MRRHVRDAGRAGAPSGASAAASGRPLSGMSPGSRPAAKPTGAPARPAPRPLALALVLLLARIAHADPMVLDNFETVNGWTTSASEGARAWVVEEPGRKGNAMRIGFDMSTAGGYVLVRKAFSLSLPENYAFTFAL